MKENEKIDETITVVDWDNADESDLNEIIGDVLKEAYEVSEDGSISLRKPFVLIIWNIMEI